VSSTTWTTPAVASEAARCSLELWRAVEAQHIVSTMSLVDTVAEQAVLERLVEESKPPVPAEVRRRKLHWLLFTPFRYPPPPGGSRFRGPNDPGVFYGAEAVRTSCAEVGYWRWRHLTESPALPAIPQKPQTVFRVAIAGSTIDLRRTPFVADRDRWTHHSDYGACQQLARTAREAPVAVIRYESVRDSRRGGCAAVLAASAFAVRAPLEQQTWILTVTRSRVVWQRSDSVDPATLEFSTAGWAGG
jgi:hypothetical protein